MSSVRAVEARWVSDEVLDLAATTPPAGRVAARFGATLHAEIDGFVVAVLPPAAPRLPNGLSVPAGLAGSRPVEVGEPAVLGSGRLSAGRLAIVWDRERPPRWDARVSRWSADQLDGLGERAAALAGGDRDGVAADAAAEALAAIDGFGADDPDARRGVASLLAAVRTQDPSLAARAARQLVGRGPGLTPVGDDILSATALTVAAAGTASGSAAGRWRDWLSALAPPDLRRRTTALSATLLALAVRGRGMGPVQALLDPRPTTRRRLAAELARLRSLGHTTGTAYAAAIAAAALTLARRTDGRTAR